ncbi:MAG TPA: hypothetical protein VEG44_04040 [Candidatus Acidoferrales bacterium]|nr:hypothetical protein [Candidatus Acidoferrales bacterium]
MLKNLTEVDSLILDLEGRDYVSVNAYEELKRTCSQDSGLQLFPRTSTRRTDL